MKILYRVSSNSYKKPRLAEATKEFCLENFIKNVVHKCDEMILIGDNVDAPLKSFLEAKTSDNIRFIDQQFGSNGASFRFQLELASSFNDDEVVLLQEDDYLYKSPGWPYHSSVSYNEIFSEALQYADYVSAYDHPDKYIAPSLGGNKFINESGVENTGLFRTPHSHWKYTNSTTCTLRVPREPFARSKNLAPFLQWRPPIRFSSIYSTGLKGAAACNLNSRQGNSY